jgi:hypothetical protein
MGVFIVGLLSVVGGESGEGCEAFEAGRLRGEDEVGAVDEGPDAAPSVAVPGVEAPDEVRAHERGGAQQGDVGGLRAHGFHPLSPTASGMRSKSR